MEKAISMTVREIQEKYGYDETKLNAMLTAAPEFKGDPNPGAQPIARGFEAFKEHINRSSQPKVEDKKVVVSIRLPSSDVEKLRAMGKGWQTKVGDYLILGIRQGMIN